jgi:anhydro-N-acetylmuramic acid kinase
MIKEFTSLGLMSGTSGDGVDASIIRSDGNNSLEIIKDEYFEYDHEIYDEIHGLKEIINNQKDLEKYEKRLKELETKITFFHAKAINRISLNKQIDLIGFHGQTIFHKPTEKISKQIGNGELLCQLTKKNVVYDFRKNDLKNNGQGAPLTPIFHQLIFKIKNIKGPICILNIGGIANFTAILDHNIKNLESSDVGPGNCLIDEWVRKNSKNKFDKNGLIASKGNVNEIILEQVQDLFINTFDKKKNSLDTKDFDISFARGLSLEDGTATLTEFTSRIIASSLNNYLINLNNQKWKILLCGGGRKNIELINRIKKHVSKKFIIELIDDHNINGDFIESQAFAYLAIRSYLGKTISFPKTTGCDYPVTGGVLIKN